jgi:hypothetical protein
MLQDLYTALWFAGYRHERASLPVHMYFFTYYHLIYIQAAS